METKFTVTDLERYGEDGWGCYRIPGIVVTASGAVLAYYETRLESGDWTTRNVGLRRSLDGGITWEPRRELVDNPGEDTINNPVMIACRDGSIHLLWQRDYRRVYHQVSRDDGATWSRAVDISGFMEGFRGEYDWTVIAMGPGHGIELPDGRLLVAIWMSNGGGRAHTPSVTATICSDDGGSTWRCGQIIPAAEAVVNPNESSVAELSDGRVMINIRHGGDLRRRAVSISPDGMGGWTTPRLDPALPDPICFGSLLRLPRSSDLAFVNCDTEGAFSREEMRHSRKNLTLKISRDDGRTWNRAVVLAEQSGYADVAASPDGEWIYCFHERGWAEDFCGKPAALAVARIDARMLADPDGGGEGPA